MKVGDLVRLSAYGSARDYNFQLLAGVKKYRVGVVVGINNNRNYTHTIRWQGIGLSRNLSHHTRIELKHAR